VEARKAPVPEVDPPLHDRTRRVLSRVLSAAVIRGLPDRFAQQADVLVAILVERGRFDAIADLAEAYSLTVFPDAMGLPPANRRFQSPYGNMLFNAFGPCNAYFERAVADAEPYWLGCIGRCDAMPSRRMGSALRSKQRPTPAS